MKPMMDSMLLAGVILTAVAGIVFTYLYLSNTYLLSDKAHAIVFAQTAASAANSLCFAEKGSFLYTMENNFTVTVSRKDGDSIIRVVYDEGPKDFYEARFLCRVSTGGPANIETLFVSKEPGKDVRINHFSGGLDEGEDCSPSTGINDFISAIGSASSRYSIDEGFLRASIRQLTGFRHCENTKLISRPNGVGAMMLSDQVRMYVTDTETEVGKGCRIPGFDYKKLDDNINAGACYLSFIRNIFSGNDDWMRLTAAGYMCGYSKIKNLVEDYANQKGIGFSDVRWEDIKVAVSLPGGCNNADDTIKHVEGVLKYYSDCWKDDCWKDECIIC